MPSSPLPPHAVLLSSPARGTCRWWYRIWRESSFLPPRPPPSSPLPSSPSTTRQPSAPFVATVRPPSSTPTATPPTSSTPTSPHAAISFWQAHPHLSQLSPHPLPGSSLSLSFFESSPSTFPLASPLARLLRRALGRPRRLSPAFIEEERAKLSEYRTWVRVQQRHQQSLQPPPFLPEGLASSRVKHRLIQGQEVIAVHPHTGEMHEGVVVGYGQDEAQDPLQPPLPLLPHQIQIH